MPIQEIPTSMKVAEGMGNALKGAGKAAVRTVDKGARAVGSGVANFVRDEAQIAALTVKDAAGIEGFRSTRNRVREIQRGRWDRKNNYIGWAHGRSPAERVQEGLTAGTAGLLTAAVDYLLPTSRSYARLEGTGDGERRGPLRKMAEIASDVATNIPLIGAAIGAVDVPTAILSKHVLNNLTTLAAHNLNVLKYHVTGKF